VTGRLVIRPPVVNDLEDISAFLADKSIEVAERFLDACRADFQRLADMPGMGRLREFSNPKAVSIRSWPISGFINYLISYRPISGGGGVEILHVLHGARDIELLFEKY